MSRQGVTGTGRRYVVVAGLLVVTTALSWVLARSAREDHDVRLQELPTVIGPWRGRDEALKKPDLVYAVLETSNVLSREYRNAGGGEERVDLLITYFRQGHRGFHPPEVSFVGAGNRIVQAGIVSIPRGAGDGVPRLEANMFRGRTSSGDVLFLYWFISGERSMASYYKSSAYRVWDAIWRRPSSASMVRVALPLVNGDLERTMAAAEQFIGDLRPLLPRYLVEARRGESPGSDEVKRGQHDDP
ncbi:MAG: exosortase C-terminal domain/associated protein EpsI [Candidatus Rokuibacteriota bacterium]